VRREHKWSASRIAFELEQDRVKIGRRTITRLLANLGLNRRSFIDPNGEINRAPQRIIAERSGHMVHIDVKKAGRIPGGGGWRVHYAQGLELFCSPSSMLKAPCRSMPGIAGLPVRPFCSRFDTHGLSPPSLKMTADLIRGLSY
jgi:hypothetical protein